MWNWFAQLSSKLSLEISFKLQKVQTSQTKPKHNLHFLNRPYGKKPKTKTSRWRVLACFLIVSHCLSGNLLALVYGENSPSDLSQQMLVQAGLWPSNRSVLLLPFTFSSSSTHDCIAFIFKPRFEKWRMLNHSVTMTDLRIILWKIKTESFGSSFWQQGDFWEFSMSLHEFCFEFSQTCLVLLNILCMESQHTEEMQVFDNFFRPKLQTIFQQCNSYVKLNSQFSYLQLQ